MRVKKVPMMAFFFKLVRWSVYCIAFYSVYCFGRGHWGASEYGLSWVQDYISRYAATLPDGKWQYIVYAMIGTGLMVGILGGLLMFLTQSRLRIVSLVSFVVAAFALVGVAYFPIERKALPQPELSNFDKFWNAMMGIEAPPSIEPDRRRSSTLHQYSIEATLFGIVIGGMCTFIALRRQVKLRKLLTPFLFYFVSVICFCYIAFNREHSNIIGLMQRLGFLTIYVWVILLTRISAHLVSASKLDEKVRI